jgi:hypothetical protein
MFSYKEEFFYFNYIIHIWRKNLKNGIASFSGGTVTNLEAK